jgi:hypothetical protein
VVPRIVAIIHTRPKPMVRESAVAAPMRVAARVTPSFDVEATS